jgi:hypothetical protein
MALESHALVRTEDVRRTLVISDTKQDSQLEFLINAASSRIARETGRRFVEETYTNQRLEGRGRSLLVNDELQWPITTITSITINETAQTIWSPGDAGEPSEQDVYFLGGSDPESRNRIIRWGGWPWLAGTIQITYTAGYVLSNPVAPSYRIPQDLQEACLAIVQAWYLEHDKSRLNVASSSMQGQAVTFVQVDRPIPTLALRLLSPFVRR